MDRLSELYRPNDLSQVIGQSDVANLAAFASSPYAKCWLLVGPPGTGKSSAALALMHELGCDHGWPGFMFENAADLGIDSIRECWRMMACSIGCPAKPHWHGWVIEELSRLSPQAQEWLKSAFELGLPKYAVVVATSNDISLIHEPVLQRFDVLEFPDSPQFRAACLDRAVAIWHEVLTQPYGIEPPRSDQLFKLAECRGHFSMRQLLTKIEQRVSVANHNKRIANGKLPSEAWLEEKFNGNA